MRLMLKILAAPFVAALTLAIWFFAFILHFSSFVFSLASTLFTICAAALLITGAHMNGAIVLVIAFLVSPFGMPMAAVWLLGKLQGLNYTLRNFITT